MIPMYRTALADTCDRLLDSYSQLLKLSTIGSSLDPGADENLGIQIAADGIESGAQSLLRLSQELKVRSILQEERAVNVEVSQTKKELKEAEEKLSLVVNRVRQECKVAMQEIMDEVSS
jgi:hypothetical protein